MHSNVSRATLTLAALRYLSVTPFLGEYSKFDMSGLRRKSSSEAFSVLFF